jgi:hypothetical protein
MLEVNLNIMKMEFKMDKNDRTFIILFVAVMQVLDVYTYIFEIVKIYFVKNSKILVLINFSKRGWTSYITLYRDSQAAG